MDDARHGRVADVTLLDNSFRSWKSVRLIYVNQDLAHARIQIVEPNAVLQQAVTKTHQPVILVFLRRRLQAIRDDINADIVDICHNQSLKLREFAGQAPQHHTFPHQPHSQKQSHYS